MKLDCTHDSEYCQDRLEILGIKYLNYFPPSVLHLLSTNGIPFLRFKLRNASNANIRRISISMEILEYSYPYFTFIDELKPNECRSVEIVPAFKPVSEMHRQQKEAHLNLRITRGAMNSKVVEYESTLKVTFLGRNDLLWSLASPFDLANSLAAFVTPRDRSIDRILTHAARRSIFRSLTGYQQWNSGRYSEGEITVDQLRSIYEAIQELNIRYVCPSTGFTAFHIQRVKFPGETVSDEWGNCIDLSVLFASALEAIGLHPAIFISRNHSFAGVYEWSDSRSVIPFDPSVVGTHTFKTALGIGIRQYEEAGDLITVDIESARKTGITPAL